MFQNMEKENKQFSQSIATINKNQKESQIIDESEENQQLLQKAAVKSFCVWTQEQIDLFFHQYVQHGALWIYLSSKLKPKSTNNIKNKFNNSVRAATKIINKLQRQQLNKRKDNITKDLMLKLLEIANQTQKSIANQNLTINWDCKLFTFKTQFLKFSLKRQNFDKDRILRVLKLANQLNIKTKSFSIYKAKSYKHWKMNQRSLNFMLTFDKIVKQDITKFVLKDQSKPKITKVKKVEKPEQQNVQELEKQVFLKYQNHNFEHKLFIHNGDDFQLAKVQLQNVQNAQNPQKYEQQKILNQQIKQQYEA